MVALANLTLTSTQATITFSSIPATYRDLYIVVEASSSTADDAVMRFNSDSTSTYTGIRMVGNGSTASSSAGLSATKIYMNYAAMTNKQNFLMSVMDYSATDKHKSVLIRNNDAGTGTMAQVSRWPIMSAITTVAISMNTGSFAVGSTFALYGVKA